MILWFISIDLISTHGGLATCLASTKEPLPFLQEGQAKDIITIDGAWNTILLHFPAFIFHDKLSSLCLSLLGNFMVSALEGENETRIPSQVLLTDKDREISLFLELAN